MSVSAVCPEEIRARNRQEKNQEVWNSERWERERAEFLRTHTVCEIKGCGATAGLLPHHRDRSTYGTEAYYDLSKCQCLCYSCHDKVESGWVPCQKCGKLVKPGYDLCWDCLPPEERERILTQTANKKRLRRKLMRERGKTTRPIPAFSTPEWHHLWNAMIIEGGCHPDCHHRNECINLRARCDGGQSAKLAWRGMIPGRRS